MERTELGNTGIKVPPIIFGTSALGNLYVALDDDIKLNIVSECFKHIQKPVVFDCAGKYGAGLALEMLGRCLQKLKIRPADVIISNKLGWFRVPLKTPEPTFEKGTWQNLKYDAIQKISHNGIIECWEQGNELLGGKYRPQLVSVHDSDEYLCRSENSKERDILFSHILDAYEALADLKSQKKVKAIGVGAKDWHIIKQISDHVKLDWVMFANSMTIMKHPPELLSFMDNLHRKGIGVINSAVFHGGFLTGSNYFDYKPVNPETDKSKFQWRDTFFALCKKHNIAPSVACVNFSMTPPGVTAVSLNTSNPKHVKDNVMSVFSDVPEKFYAEMVKNNLISKDYPYLGN